MNLEITKLEQAGRYKYIGFLLINEPTSKLADELDEEGNTITLTTKGVSALVFKDETTNKLFAIENNEILDSSEERPYGMFQQLVSNLLTVVNIEYNENFDYVITV